MLKTGNCCWLVFSIFLACVQTKFWQKVVRLRCRKAFSFLIFHTNSFHVAENSVHISSRLLVCVCTFLLVDKIVYGLSAFGDACFSFCIKSFPIFRIINSLGECSSSSSIFEILVKFQSFLLWRRTIFTFFFRCFGCKVLICQLCSKTEIHGFDCFHGNGLYYKIPTEKEPIRAHGFAQDWLCHIIIVIVIIVVSLFIPVFDWFCGKNSQPRIVIMTVYRGVQYFLFYRLKLYYRVNQVRHSSSGACKGTSKKTLNLRLSVAVFNSFLLEDSFNCHKTCQVLSR